MTRERNTKMNTRRLALDQLVITGLFIALHFVLVRLLSILIGGVIRVDFGFLPMALLAIMYGPLWGGGAYAAGDILGAHLMPQGAPFYGFTLSSFLSGLIYGFVMKDRKVTWIRVIIATWLVIWLVDMGLNTYWLTIIRGMPFKALFMIRLPKAFLYMILQPITIMAVWTFMKKRIPYVQKIAE